MDDGGSTSSWWARALLGDSVEAALQGSPTSYEDVHATVQSILLPPMLPKGITIHLLQSVNKQFALQHRVGVVPGELQRTMFGPMPGPGARFYSLGAVVSNAGAGSGAKWRATGQYDPEQASGKGIFLGDVWGDGRLRVTAAVTDSASDAGGSQWGATATLRGSDYVAVARAKHGPEVGLSYNQRLAPGSAVTIGAEAMLHVGDARRGPQPGAAFKPLDVALGAALDAGGHFSAVHVAATKAFSAGVLSLHHLYRITDRSAVAAKLMASLGENKRSMVAAGYRMHFRNTLTTIYGTVDSYGCVRQVIEREPVKDLKVLLSLETKLPVAGGAAAAGEAAILGFKVSLGAMPPNPPPLSPLTMTREIFSAS